jgi:rubredoxin
MPLRRVVWGRALYRPARGGRDPCEHDRARTWLLPVVPHLLDPYSEIEGRPVTELHPSTMVTDPTDDDACPHCGATHGVQPMPAPPTVQAWTCTACGMDWAVTVVNPTVRVVLSVVGLLPTPQLRTAALLAVLRTEVTQRSAKEHHPMPDTVCFPVTELVNIDPHGLGRHGGVVVPVVRAGGHRGK